jgi:putative transposase
VNVPRRARLFIAGLSQHVIQRGNNRGVIFRVPSDYQVFLAILRHAAGQCRVEVHGYVLMTNHLHFIVTPASRTSLPEMMQTIGRAYVPFFNSRYARTGALWEGRYRASILHDDKYWMTCLRYVELNPVRAGLVAAPELYRWSSYRAHALGRQDTLVTPHPLYLAIGSSPVDRQQAWRAVCRVPIGEEHLTTIRRSIHAGRALGEPAFHEGAEGPFDTSAS